MRQLSLVSPVRANGVAWLTSYAATVPHRLAILVTLVGNLIAFTACKDQKIEQLDAVKRAVCTCKDAACADRALGQVPSATIEATPRARAIAKDIMDCRAKLEAAERPTSDPDAEGDGSDEGSAAAPAAPAPGSAAR
jgi:hypothetical protein